MIPVTIPNSMFELHWHIPIVFNHKSQTIRNTSLQTLTDFKDFISGIERECVMAGFLFPFILRKEFQI